MARDLYTVAWDYARLNLGAVGGANAAVFSGAVTGNVGWTSGVYMHSAVTGTCDGLTIASFRAAIIAIATGLTIDWSPTTGLYTLSNAGAFTVTWSGALGTQIRDALGFAGASTGSAISHTSTVRPDYMIISRLAGQSKVHATYEEPGQISSARSDDGTTYSTRPTTLATLTEWTQNYETATGPTNAEWTSSAAVGGAPMRRSDATTTAVSWSWEDFYKAVRAELPFALLDRAVTTKGEGAIYKLDATVAHFDPTRITEDYDGHWAPRFTAIVKTATAAA